MTRIIALALLCGCLTMPARADEAPSADTLKAAEELTAIVNADTVAQMSGEMTAQIWPSIENSLSAKVDAATLAELRTEFERSVTAFAGETTKYTPAVYARHFTAPEMREIVAFYRTPTGAKSLHVMPLVMADVMAQMGPRVQTFQTDLNTKIVAIMQKHGYKN